MTGPSKATSARRILRAQAAAPSPAGYGWYRKNFTLAPEQRGKNIFVDFDGVYMNSTVFINGHELGTRPYGYASFGYNITPWLNPRAKM